MFEKQFKSTNDANISSERLPVDGAWNGKAFAPIIHEAVWNFQPFFFCSIYDLGDGEKLPLCCIKSTCNRLVPPRSAKRWWHSKAAVGWKGKNWILNWSDSATHQNPHSSSHSIRNWVWSVKHCTINIVTHMDGARRCGCEVCADRGRFQD